MKLPFTKVSAEYTKFVGGLNQEAAAMTFPPGAIFASQNYVSTTDGGYRRIDGYERYSGQPSPSDATYTSYLVTFSAAVAVGDTILGSVSGETGVVVCVDSTSMQLTKLSGDLQLEAFTVSGSPKGTITAIAEGVDTILADATCLAAAADEYRGDIAKPAGTYAIRGLGILKGTLYCFTDNSGGTAGEIYKATSSGWSNVPLLTEISFDTGVGTIADGDTITQLTSGATALVKRAVLETGAWKTDAAGRLILDTITGTFDATNDLQVASVTQATATSLATAITITVGGRYEIEEYNFSGDVDNTRLYGCDGVNRGFEFDGEIYVPIVTGLTDDTPLHVATHKLQLFFSFRSSSFNSVPGSPYEWSAISGASEIAIGDTITGFKDLAGESLGIFGRNHTKQLNGNNVNDFVLDNVSNEIGALHYSIQQLENTFAFDDRGIVLTVASDAYGNFQQAVLSRRIQPLINAIQSVLIASTVYRADDQCRFYGSDGTGICMTKVGKSYDFTFFFYSDVVSCVTYGEDASGNQVIFFGTSDGMVMQADKGSSFDGTSIEAFITFPFNNSESPTTLKTYRKGTFEMSSESYTEIKVSTELSYGTANLPANDVLDQIVIGPGGFWDINFWEAFFYDQETVASPSFRINGTGINMSLTVYSNSAIDLGHKFDGIIVHYTPRRLQR
ncbi:MAG: hypothetical protein GY845_03365 [Planctomycetes bacterium]|nr:hypothetical protein [Planctomycetota bacterium]